MLVSYRRELVEDRTAQSNRLHADLGKLRPGYHQIIPRFTTRQSLDQAMKLLWRDTTPHGRVAKHASEGCDNSTPGSNNSPQRSKLWSTNPEPDYSTFTGWCAGGCHHPFGGGQPPPLCDQRQVAMANGTAPIEASSGRVVRHRLNRGGNRQLNRAIHTAALTQIARPDSEGRRYYQKLKTTRENPQRSPTRPQRRISDRVWTHLQPPKPAQILT